MAKIDAPLFHDVAIRCFYPFIFSISQAAALFSRTTSSKHLIMHVLSFTVQWPRQGHTFLHQHRHMPYRIFSPEKSYAAGQNSSFVPLPVFPFYLMLLSHLRGSISVIILARRLRYRLRRCNGNRSVKVECAVITPTF